MTLNLGVIVKSFHDFVRISNPPGNLEQQVEAYIKRYPKINPIKDILIEELKEGG
jgi:hypothetical protein